VSIAVASGVAGVWSAASNSGFWAKAGLVLMVIAGLLVFTGTMAFSRAETTRARAFLGQGPEAQGRDTGQGLTGVGVFLFVALPLFVLGAVLFDGA
jgi:hypothetical protein